jgi:hypothetical protein
MLCHPRGQRLNYIAANSITLSRGAADAGACDFFISAMRHCQVLCPAFGQQLVYFTQHETVSRKRKARDELVRD